MDEIRFYRVNEDYGFLSNFSKHPIFTNNKIWRTVEHYFQASKFEDDDLREVIRAMDSPMEAAKEGRNPKNRLRPDWDELRDEYMYKALMCKFLQNPDIKSRLLSTGDSRIIEHTSNDKYWADGGDGSGTNRLGQLLMDVRAQIRQYSAKEDLVLPPWIAFPQVASEDMFWRMGLGEDYLLEWARYVNRTDINIESYQALFPPPNGWADAYMS